ncbi:hypothetical protein AB0B13_02955 [Streptomyces sp. NPDC042898]|uniref:hypothetical protein n=1 Tax=unclassified Streptomyces TaxID=2593676 RepID=UPI00331BD226
MTNESGWRAAASDRREAARRKQEADAVVASLRSWWAERFDQPMRLVGVTDERQAPDSDIVRGLGREPDAVTPTSDADDLVASLLAGMAGDTLHFLCREGSHLVAWELSQDLFRERWREFVTEDGGLCEVADSQGKVRAHVERDSDFSAETARQDMLLLWSA